MLIIKRDSIMKKILILFLLLLTSSATWSQPEPYPIDKTFIPELVYLQKKWYGEYIGVDPTSKVRISIRRTLCLYQDMTFSNTTYGIISSNTETPLQMLLMSEYGNYSYNSNNVTYVVLSDSALDMNAYLKLKKIIYKVNNYSEGSKSNIYTELVQFTFLSGNERQWVLQDSKMGSDQMQGMPAVYLMKGTEFETDFVGQICSEQYAKDTCIYDISGKKLLSYPLNRSLIIKGGKKRLLK